MSADNWTICPKCNKSSLQLEKKEREKIKNSYGKISAEEYLELVRQHKLPKKIEDTLREDYEIGIDENGGFSIHYSCYCEECRFKFEFNYNEIIKFEDKSCQ